MYKYSRVRRLSISILFMAAGLSVHEMSYSQPPFWRSTGGPAGADILTLSATSDNSVYAGTNGDGVYRSTNSGQNWLRWQDGLANTRIRCLTSIRDGSVFAGTYFGGIVYRSTDNGATWTSSLSLTVDDGIYCLATNSNGHVFVGTGHPTSAKGVYRSTDNGETWNQMVTGLANKYIISLLVSRTGIVYAGTNSTLFRSTDSGESWFPLAGGLPASTTFWALAVDSAGTILTGTINGFFRSTDEGQAWMSSSTGLPPSNVSSFGVAATGEILAGTFSDGVFRSTNNGATWTASNSGNPDMGIQSVGALRNGVLILGSRSGAFRSTDVGTTWMQTNAGLLQTRVNSLFRYSDQIILAGAGPTIFRSTNEGHNWIQASGLPNTGYMSFTKTLNGDAFTGTTWGYVYRSTDGGSTWIPANTGWPAAGVSALISNAAGHVYATNTVVFRTTNSGASWTGTTLPNYAIPFSLAIAGGSSLFVGTHNYGLFRSADNGITWIPCGGNFAGTRVQALLFDSGGSLFAGANIGSGGSVYYSRDKGATWEIRSSGLPNMSVSSIVMNSNGHLFASTYEAGIYRSKNHGQTWEPVNGGLTTLGTTSLAVGSDGFLQAGTVAGVFQSVQSTTLLSLQSDSITFDTVHVADTRRDSVLVKNGGTEDLVITSAQTNTTDFLVTPQSATISVGERRWFHVDFAPSTYGPIAGTVTFVSNANSSPDELTLKGTGKAAYLQLAISDVSFGRTLLGTWKDTTLQLVNIGNDLLTVAGIVSSNSHFQARPTTIEVLPGQAFYDTIRFAPTTLGGISSEIVLASNSLSSPDTLGVSGIGFGVPRLFILSHEIMVGTTHTGMSKDTLVTLSNAGNDTLKFFGVESSRPTFAVLPGDPWLPPGGARSDTMRFTPTTFGSDSTSIIYRTNSPSSPDTLRIFGFGDSIVTPPEPPISYRLYQNYPNPFNSSTIIVFDIPQQGFTILQIFNILGQEVARLVNEDLARAQHAVTWSASGFPSGIYFYRLRSNAFVEIKRLILVR